MLGGIYISSSYCHMAIVLITVYLFVNVKDF